MVFVLCPKRPCAAHEPKKSISSEDVVVPIHDRGLKPVLVLYVAKLLKLFHRHLIPMHDCDEVAQVWLRETLRLDVKNSTLNTFYAGYFLSPFEERLLIKI
jgi:hypothetical protein